MTYLFFSAMSKLNPSYRGEDAKNTAAKRHGLKLQVLNYDCKFGANGMLCCCDEKMLPEKRREIIADAEAGNICGGDVMIMDHLPSLAKPGALVMDMDMTTVQIEGIDEIARRLGVYEQVAAITSEAMHGNLDFATSLKRRVAMLKGGSVSFLDEVKKIMTETEGLKELMEVVTLAGWKKAVCSGGFTQLIDVIDKKYGLDLIKANTLAVSDGRFTGEVAGEIVDAEAKRRGVLEIMERYSIPKEQVIVIGDGANDLKMMQEGGLGIAYWAKPKVRAQAPQVLSRSFLSAVALLLMLNS